MSEMNQNFTPADPDSEETMPLSSREPGFEQRVFGRLGTFLRNLCGTVSVLTVCYVAHEYIDIVRISVSAGNGWPGEWYYGVILFGPMIVAWTFMNATKVINTILSAGNGIRERAKGILFRNQNVSNFPVTTQYETVDDVVRAVRAREITPQIAESLKDSQGIVIMMSLSGKSPEERRAFWEMLA